MKVLRVAHHAVVSAWRQRERELRTQGWSVELFSARRWNEGGRRVPLDKEHDTFVHGVSTVGDHPNAFLYDPRPLWRALRAGPDLLDLHEEPFALATAEILALRALSGSRVPYLLYSAQNIEKRYPAPFRWFEAWALRGASGAYVCNAEAGEILVRKGLRGPAALIPLGVDIEQFRPADRAAPGEDLVVGYVGRLETHKGVHVLLRAAATRPHWRVRIVGDGPQRIPLQTLAAELGIASRVSFVGFATGESLAANYRELDVLVVPSLPQPGWLEQFCRVAVEAMASGVAVVASRTGAIPDVVGDNGVLVPPNDSDALALGVDEATAEWESFRARGIEHSRDFTWQRVAQLQGDLYRQALARRDSGRGLPPQIIVVAYGSPELLATALADLGDEFPVTIVDNSSSPETRALAESHSATYVDPGANLGFGAGVNIALRSLADRGLEDHDVLLLNPDARLTPDGVRSLQRTLRADARVAVVGATQTDPVTGEDVRVWWPFPSPARAWLEAMGMGRLNRAHDFAIGSVLLIRAEAIAEVGEFDEQFFLYSEETDWQRRAVRAGWRIVVAQTGATHLGGATSSESQVRVGHFHASAERYQRKHYGAIGWQVYRLAMVAGAGVRVLALRGAARSSARDRLRLYIRGPVAAVIALEASR